MRVDRFSPLWWMAVLLMLFGAVLPDQTRADEQAGIAALSPQDAWVRTPPPGARMLAGYLTLHNRGEQPVSLVAARSPAFAMVEIHQSYEKDGRMRMREVNPLEIPAGEAVELSPGGLHLMLMRPHEALTDGEKVTIVLIDERERELEVVFSVRREAPEEAPQH